MLIVGWKDLVEFFIVIFSDFFVMFLFVYMLNFFFYMSFKCWKIVNDLILFLVVIFFGNVIFFI